MATTPASTPAVNRARLPHIGYATTVALAVGAAVVPEILGFTKDGRPNGTAGHVFAWAVTVAGALVTVTLLALIRRSRRRSRHLVARTTKAEQPTRSMTHMQTEEMLDRFDRLQAADRQREAEVRAAARQRKRGAP